MERWESVVDTFPSALEPRHFDKVLQTAAVTLKQDLAQFEIDWIIETLLLKPVHILNTVTSKRNEDVWSKTITDCFKLLAEIVDSHAERIEPYYEDIVSACLRPYDAQIKKQAIQCLTRVARRSPIGATDARQHLANLDNIPSCRAPLALLIGTICEYHPETVEKDFTKIWRVYLNLLDSSKNTDKLTSALLQGIAGLLKHFGCNLPTLELNVFYDKMATDYIQMSSCEAVCFNILELHSDLFRERLGADVRVRNYLWNSVYASRGAKALRAVYLAASTALERNLLLTIMNTEVKPQTESHRTNVKYTALRVLRECGCAFLCAYDIDTQTLQYELTDGNVTYDVAEAISWCIESNSPGSDQLLQSAILFYTNIPSSRRKEIVVHGLLNAPSELRTPAVNFLITQSCLDSSLDQHLPLWKDLFDSSSEDQVVLEKSRLVFEDFMAYVIFVMETALEEDLDLEKLPEKLTTLLLLTSHVLNFQRPEDYTADYSSVLLGLLASQPASHAAVVAAIRGARVHSSEEPGLSQMLRIDGCRDEALLCESCLALIEAPTHAGEDVAGVLSALQIIFSRFDVEPKMLSKSLEKFESLINSGNDQLDQKCITDIIRLVTKLRDRKDLSGKDARVLRRDVLMFLGKYGNRTDANNNSFDNDDTFVMKLKDILALNIHNPNEGTSYKINLQRILDSAIKREDPRALHMLLIIICANLSTRKEPLLQLALTRTAHALSRAHAHALSSAVDARALQSAVLLCDTVPCVQALLTYISEERSPGVRRMISDALEGLLLQDPGSRENEALVACVGERAAVMMSSEDATTKKAGLDITQTLITALKENNALAIKLLTNILELISKTHELYSGATFELASTIFMEKIELFDNCVLEKLVKNLMEISLTYPRLCETQHKSKLNSQSHENKTKHNMADVSVMRIYRNTVQKNLKLIKKVFDYKKEDSTKILKLFFEVFANCNDVNFESLYVLAAIRNVFDLNTDLCRNVLSYNGFCIMNKLFCIDVFDAEENYIGVKAVLNFLEQYAEILLELKYERTRDFIAAIIKNLTPKCIKHLQRDIKTCFNVYNKFWKNTPLIILTNFENWRAGLQVKEITVSIEKHIFTTEHAVAVNSLKIMLSALNLTDPSILTDDKSNIQKWPKILLKLHSTGYMSNYLKTKMSYLTDLLTVSVNCLSVPDIKRLILEGHNLQGVQNENVGIQFCRFFIHVFADYLTRKPYFLLDGDMATCCILIHDLIRHVLKKKWTDQQYDDVLDLVNQLWPTYETQTTLTQKHTLLLDLASLPRRLDPESNPMRWATSLVCSESASREDKARLIGVLPGGEAYSQAYRIFASSLPTRLSELHGAARPPASALLAALAANRDPLLLNLVMTLASGDDTKGWWDDAIDSCMASIAPHGDDQLCKAVYTRCWEGLSLGVCRRVLIPLLRYSTPSFCERFFSTIIKDLLKIVSTRRTAPSAHYEYHKSIVNYTRTLNLLELAFEKIPPSSLESPNSVLYCGLQSPKPWELVRETCRYGVGLRDNITCPPGSDDKLVTSYRLFHCANYNCLCAAICRRRPGVRFYDEIFNHNAWTHIVEKNIMPKLPLRSHWNQRSVRAPVSIELEGGGGMTSLTRTATLRSRMFLRTLSENPLHYDLIDLDHDTSSAEQVETQELHITENELNTHECAAVLSGTVRHASALPHTAWRDTLASALTGELNTPVKMLLAQIICNCKEELSAHASVLRPALLAFVASTASVENGKRLLNGLHVDVLSTVLLWRDEAPRPSPQLHSCVQCLLATCLENRQRQAIYRTLQDLLNKLIEVYGAVVQVDWSVIEPYLSDKSTEANKTITILQLLTKSKIHIPELLPTVLLKLESKHPNNLSELFGLAVGCQSDREDALKIFRKVLDKTKKDNVSEYIQMLYYAQRGHIECCDEIQFKTITHLTPQMVGRDKTKCLRIISAYISSQPASECVTDMLDIILVQLWELLTTNNVEALGVVERGLPLMKEGDRRRAVALAAEGCRSAESGARGAARGVMLRALEGLYKTTYTGPSAKKLKTDVTTPITSALESADVYITTVLTSLGAGTTDPDADIARAVRDGVSKLLHKDNMSVRFAECFMICIYLPVTSQTVGDRSRDMSGCVSALMDMFFSDLRSQERFKKIRLRDEPLERREPSGTPSKLLTMSAVYQGTFRGLTSTRSHARNLQVSDASSPDIDVQIPVDTILDNLLQFAKDTPEAAEALCLQVVKSLLKREGRGFDFRVIMMQQLAAILEHAPHELTPLAIELCVLFIEDGCPVDRLQDAVKSLKKSTIGTDGESITKLLFEEVKLRCSGLEQFVLGRIENSQDVGMVETEEFTIEDLTSAFGKLSNWDDLTIQQKKRIRNSALPPLWTDLDTFKACLDDYRGADGWFSKMVSAYRRDVKQSAATWLRAMDTWPRRAFAISAVTEAIEWQSARRDNTKFPCDIQSSDCLAEWAARFMIRTAYLNSLEGDSEPSSSNNMLSRSHELVWCERANEMALPTLVLDCVKRNMPNLYRSESLSWLHQRVAALRTVGLETNNTEVLKKALNSAETYMPKFFDISPADVKVGLLKVVLLLNRDLNTLSKEKLDGIIQEMDKQKPRAKTNGQALNAVYELAITYYDELWEGCSDSSEQNDLIANMSDILGRMTDLDLPRSHCYLDLILNRLDHYDGCLLPEDVARKLLNEIKSQVHNLDDFAVEQLKSHISLFPSHLVNEYRFMSERDNDSVVKYKQCFQLICDAEYLLLQYCDLLQRALLTNDEREYKEVFCRMKDKMFGNPYAGSDYQLLTKYKNNLYEIEDFDSTEYFKQKAEPILKSTIRELRVRRPQTVLRLSQLCPDLVSRSERDAGERDTCLARLLGLPAGVNVVRFDEQVPLFTDAIRRPAVLRALLSTGASRRWLHKSGEPLRGDAAAMRVLRAAAATCTGRESIATYNVTPLSEDCALIEFLEDHERLRALISSFCDLDVIQDPRQADDELILAPPQASLRQYQQLCEKVPCYALRAAVHTHCATLQDFVARKSRFTDTVAAMTVLNWVLGLGDRHLQNIMYSLAEGGVCCVDWAALLQYEMSPARLTRTVLAMCDTQVLESRLQCVLGALRDSSKLLIPVMKTSFKWMGPRFNDKFHYIESILQGKMVSYDVTRDVILTSKATKHKHKYVQLLDDVFREWHKKDEYSVDEQISYLLHQCTEPRILCIIRSGWEPWV